MTNLTIKGPAKGETVTPAMPSMEYPLEAMTTYLNGVLNEQFNRKKNLNLNLILK
ncbi:hypothetical protein CHS0354_035397, partial [Potamilus streckersoni]